MADTARSSAVLKTYFETGDIPTQQQFADWLTSYANIVDFNTLLDTETSITAHAGGGQGSAYALTKYNSGIQIVNTAGDSVLLPSALINRSGVIVNYSAKAANVFPVSGQEINGLGVNVPVSLPNGYAMFYYSLFNSEWYFEMKSLAGINVAASLSQASASTLAPNLQAYKSFTFTALAAGLTVNAPTSIFGDGQTFTLTITDNGTIRSLNWDAIFLGVGAPLPSTTVLSKKMIFQFQYNAAAVKWMLVSSVVESYYNTPVSYYKARIDPQGTGAPLATIMQNTLGFTPTWTRVGTGDYRATHTSGFPSDKVFCTGVGEASNGDSFIVIGSDSEPDFIYVHSFDNTGAQSDDLPFFISFEILP